MKKLFQTFTKDLDESRNQNFFEAHTEIAKAMGYV